MKNPVFYRTIEIDGFSIFYRRVGIRARADASSTSWIAVIVANVRMSDRYHLIAPDYPGFVFFQAFDCVRQTL